VLKVLDFAERRGSSEDARALCEDLAPAARAEAKLVTPAIREAGAGRPTKRDRRAMTRFTGEDDE
jgi:ribosome-associated heat shock protein Hsp15